jgi:hypothetical protein
MRPEVSFFVDLFGASRLPYMARRAYVIEMWHFLLWGLFAGLVEGTVSAVVVSKTFDAGPLLITIVQATPAFANLVSLFWGALIVGRPKMPVFLSVAAASVAVTLSVAATPHTAAGGWIFALQICLSRVFMCGVVTTRASLWKSNYPRSHRGRITANLQIVRTLMSLPVILGGGLLFDLDHSAYHWFYPLVAILGAMGLLVLRGERVRGERRDAARRSNGDEPIADAGLIQPFSLVTLISPGQLFARMGRALREDPRFARYCQAQMCIGTANLMAMPVNTIVLTKVMELSYTASNTLLDIVPRVVTVLMLPVWARLFDRVGVLRFRVTNSLCWCGSLLFCGVGALFASLQATGSLPGALTFGLAAYGVGRLFEGLAQSGGAIAWNIGHLHFAEDDKAELYMGIHVSLTGLRGLIAPFVGTLLYAWIGWVVFLVGFVISGLGFLIFSRLAREEIEDDAVSPPGGPRGSPEALSRENGPAGERAGQVAPAGRGSECGPPQSLR